MTALLVVNKPQDSLSGAGQGSGQGRLPDRPSAVCSRVLLVHRLDAATSGMMVFALTKAARKPWPTGSEKRQTKKVYVARLSGLLEPKEGTVDLPLCVDSG